MPRMIINPDVLHPDLLGDRAYSALSTELKDYETVADSDLPKIAVVVRAENMTLKALTALSHDLNSQYYPPSKVEPIFISYDNHKKVLSEANALGWHVLNGQTPQHPQTSDFVKQAAEAAANVDAPATYLLAGSALLSNRYQLQQAAGYMDTSDGEEIGMGVTLPAAPNLRSRIRPSYWRAAAQITEEAITDTDRVPAKLYSLASPTGILTHTDMNGSIRDVAQQISDQSLDLALFTDPFLAVHVPRSRL